MRCKVRLCMLRARAVAEMLPSCSSNTRCKCSQVRRFSESGSFSNGVSAKSVVAVWSLKKQCKMVSMSAGLGRYSQAPSLMSLVAVVMCD